MPFSSSFCYSSLTQYFIDKPSLESDMDYLSVSNLLDSNANLFLGEKIHGKYSLLEYLLMRGIPDNKNQVLEISPILTKSGWPIYLHDYIHSNVLESNRISHRNWLQASIVSCSHDIWTKNNNKGLPKEVELALLNDDSELLEQLIKLPNALSLEEIISSPFEGFKFIDGLGSEYGNWWRYLLSHVSEEKPFSKNIVHFTLSHGVLPVAAQRKDHPCFSASIPAIQMLLDFDAFPKELVEDWCKNSLSNRKWLKLYPVEKIDEIVEEVSSLKSDIDNVLENKQEKMLFTKTLMKFWGGNGAFSIYNIFDEIVDASDLKFESFVNYKDKVSMFDGDWNLPSLLILYSVWMSSGSHTSKIEVTNNIISKGFGLNDFSDKEISMFENVYLGDGSFSLSDLLKFDDSYTSLIRGISSYSAHDFNKKFEVDEKFIHIVDYITNNINFTNNIRGFKDFLQFNKKMFECTSKVESPSLEKIQLILLHKRFDYLANSKVKDKDSIYISHFYNNRYYEMNTDEFKDAFKKMDQSKELIELNFLKLVLIDTDSSGNNTSWNNERDYIDLFFSKYSNQVQDLLFKVSKSSLLSNPKGNVQKYLIEKCIALSLSSNKINVVKRERF